MSPEVHQHPDQTLTLTIAGHRVGHYSAEGKLLTPLTKKQLKAAEKTFPLPLRLTINQTGHFICYEKRTFLLANDTAEWATNRPEPEARIEAPAQPRSSSSRRVQHSPELLSFSKANAALVFQAVSAEGWQNGQGFRRACASKGRSKASGDVTFPVESSSKMTDQT